MKTLRHLLFGTGNTTSKLPRQRQQASLALAALSMLLPTGASAANNSGYDKPSQIAFVSDVHFDPYSLRAVPRAQGIAGLEAWRRTLTKVVAAQSDPIVAAKVRACTGPDQTTTMPILDGATRTVAAQAPTALIVSGDLLVQQFECKFRAVFTNFDDKQYREFAAGTARFVLWKFKLAVRRRPVLFAPGNHDSGCGNYRRNKDDPFLADLAGDVAALATNNPEIRRSIVRQFRGTGGFHLPQFAGFEKLDAIVVDTSPLSRNAAGCATGAPASPSAIVDWTRSELMMAKQAARRVWVIGHIPPGTDVRASISPTGTANPALRFYRNDDFDNVLYDFSQTVALAVFGHTHMDEFRHPGGVLIKIVPAVSPGSGNDPAAMIASITDRGNVVDYTVFHSPPSKSKGGWTKLYSFNSAYSMSGFQLSNLSQWPINSPNWAIYRRYYYAGNGPMNFLREDEAWEAYFSNYFNN